MWSEICLKKNFSGYDKCGIKLIVETNFVLPQNARNAIAESCLITRTERITGELPSFFTRKRLAIFGVP